MEVVDLAAVRARAWSRLVLRVAGDQVALATLAYARVLPGDIDVVLCANENQVLVLVLVLAGDGRRRSGAPVRQPAFLIRARRIGQPMGGRHTLFITATDAPAATYAALSL